MNNLNEITVNIPALNERSNIFACIKSAQNAGIKKIAIKEKIYSA
tara:strand:+ start:112 stop:246 length:135 start_codon:yes stop_codon:yes gene_type:complete